VNFSSGSMKLWKSGTDIIEPQFPMLQRMSRQILVGLGFRYNSRICTKQDYFRIVPPSQLFLLKPPNSLPSAIWTTHCTKNLADDFQHIRDTRFSIHFAITAWYNLSVYWGNLYVTAIKDSRRQPLVCWSSRLGRMIRSKWDLKVLFDYRITPLKWLLSANQ